MCRVIPSSFGNPTDQPLTALRFPTPAGLAIDHENYPKLVSIPWPIVLDQQKSYLIVINRPSLDTSDAKNTAQANSINVTQLTEDRSTFKWDCPPVEIKDPVVRAPGQKAPMCASTNGCMVQNFTDSIGVNGIASNPSWQPRAPPPLIKPNARPIHVQHGVNKRPKLEHAQTRMNGGSLLNNSCSNSQLSDDTAMIKFLEQKDFLSNKPNCGMVNSPATSSTSLSQELPPCPRQEVSTTENPNQKLEHAKVDKTLLSKFARIQNLQFSLRQREDNTLDIQTNGSHTSSSMNQIEHTSLASSSNAHSSYPGRTSLGDKNTTGSSENIPEGPLKSSTALELVQSEQQVRFCKTSFPGSLLSASLSRWNRDPGWGWSRDHLSIQNRRVGGYSSTFGREDDKICLLYTSPSPRDLSTSRMPSSA